MTEVNPMQLGLVGMVIVGLFGAVKYLTGMAERVSEKGSRASAETVTAAIDKMHSAFVKTLADLQRENQTFLGNHMSGYTKALTDLTLIIGQMRTEIAQKTFIELRRPPE